jgi:hypothetical protein
MAVAVANARQLVAAPVRQPRKFGLFSVVETVDSGEAHWLLGGLTSDGEECSRPEGTSIVCGPTQAFSSRSWYSDIEADPWLAYMYETCKTVGRVDESAAKLRSRFLASEQSAVETEFQDNVLDTGTSLGLFGSVTQAVGALEADAAAEYGGQITLHLGFLAAEEAFSKGGLVRVGDHLETHAGSLVSVGNYHADHAGGSATAPVVYATGETVLYRSALVETGPVLGHAGAQNEYSNDYYVLIERGYAALVDCYMASATGTLCDCGGA